MFDVATVLTVYGIETCSGSLYEGRRNVQVATVLTVYGIETCSNILNTQVKTMLVATVLTVYGIETKPLIVQKIEFTVCCNSTYRLRY